MSMEIIKVDVGKPRSVVKRMNTMARGEVCYCDERNMYVMKISFVDPERVTVYLHLNDGGLSLFISFDEFANKLEVRELYEGESITIKFS